MKSNSTQSRICSIFFFYGSESIPDAWSDALCTQSSYFYPPNVFVSKDDYCWVLGYPARLILVFKIIINFFFFQLIAMKFCTVIKLDNIYQKQNKKYLVIIVWRNWVKKCPKRLISGKFNGEIRIKRFLSWLRNTRNKSIIFPASAMGTRAIFCIFFHSNFTVLWGCKMQNTQRDNWQ